MEFKLKYPIAGVAGTITSVNVGEARVTVGDMMAVAEMTKGREAAEGPGIVARMCGLMLSDVEKMDLDDYNPIYKAIMSGKA